MRPASLLQVAFQCQRTPLRGGQLLQSFVRIVGERDEGHVGALQVHAAHHAGAVGKRGGVARRIHGVQQHVVGSRQVIALVVADSLINGMPGAVERYHLIHPKAGQSLGAGVGVAILRVVDIDAHLT